MEKFNVIITKRRKELLMTQRELAEKINVSDKTISKWENGGSYPELPMLHVIAKALQMNVSDLIGASDLQEKEVEPVEKYDKDRILTFKIQTIISFMFSLLGFILWIVKDSVNNQIIVLILKVSSIFLIIFGLFIFVIGIIIFRNFYIDKFFRKQYDLTFYNYTISYVLAYCLLGIVGAILGIFGVGLQAFIILTMIIIIPIFLEQLLMALSKLRYKHDIYNKLILGFIIFLIFIFTSIILMIIPLPMLRIVIFLLYISIVIISYRYQYQK